MCGIVGIIGKVPIVNEIYQGLIHLQHRGQDAAGISAYDPRDKRQELYKNTGLVNEVFNADILPLEDASWAIGHVRYATVGQGSLDDVQPLKISNSKYSLSIVHNGNIVNYIPLKEQLQNMGETFVTTCDTEIILNILHRHFPIENFNFESLCRAVKKVYQQVTGAYSVIGLISGKGMFAFRDPLGLRPLLYSFNSTDNSHAFASESGALKINGYEKIHDVEPGEVIFIDSNYYAHRSLITSSQHAHCSFEYNYFAKPNSSIEQREVYQIRSTLGIYLAEEIKKQNLHIDVIVPIPDSSRPSAISLARTLNLPFEEGFVKQNYVGRTFIMSTQYARKKALSQKLMAVESVFKNKNILLIDDSIVRGTVSKKVIGLAREAGANKIYFASTFPPIRYPCLYGIDFPNNDQLIAHTKTIDEIQQELTADGLIYNSIENLKNAIGLTDLCTACLTGEYPTTIEGMEELQSLRKTDIFNMELSCN